MPKKFSGPVDGKSDVIPQQNFQSTFVDKTDRTSVYRKWSEKATVVKYNSDVQTYDLIVTIASYSTNADSASVSSKSSRTMRGIKSIIPASVHIFQPGEVVLIGYISERRESPVILGLRAYALTNTVSEINTPGGPLSSCPLRVSLLLPTGDVDVTDMPEVTVDCSDLGATGTMSATFEARCAVGKTTWTWNADPDCYP